MQSSRASPLLYRLSKTPDEGSVQLLVGTPTSVSSTAGQGLPTPTRRAVKMPTEIAENVHARHVCLGHIAREVVAEPRVGPPPEEERGDLLQHVGPAKERRRVRQVVIRNRGRAG